MPECLVIAQIVTQGLLERAHRDKEPIVGRTAPQHPPEALDHLQLRTIAGQPVQLDMRQLVERRGDQGALVPGGVVDHQHDARVLRSRIGPGDIAQVPRKRLLQGSGHNRAFLYAKGSIAQQRQIS